MRLLMLTYCVLFKAALVEKPYLLTMHLPVRTYCVLLKAALVEKPGVVVEIHGGDLVSTGDSK